MSPEDKGGNTARLARMGRRGLLKKRDSCDGALPGKSHDRNQQQLVMPRGQWYFACTEVIQDDGSGEGDRRHWMNWVLKAKYVTPMIVSGKFLVMD